MRHLFVGLSLFATVLIAPAAASAATVSIAPGAPTAGGVRVEASPSATVNTITVSVVDTTHLRVVDTTEALTESVPECTQVNSSTVECAVTALAADVIAGGGDDVVTIVGPIRSYMAGFTGNDTLQGGSGVDELEGGGDNDTLRGGAGNDFLYDSYSSGTSGDDDLDGEGDSDLIYGGGGADTLHDSGASGVDAITHAFAPSGQGVTLRVADGLANDGTGGGAEGDEIQTGFESIQGSPAGDTIVGGPAPETINGSAGADDLDGGLGADTIEGNAGEDTLRTRDGVADVVVDCDSASTPALQQGTAETAFIDAADPEPQRCETVERLPGGPTPTPTPGGPTPTLAPGHTPAPGEPTPTPGNPGESPTPDSAALCPTAASLSLRTSAAFAVGSRVQVSMPVAGWTALVQLISTEDGKTLLGIPSARTASAPGLLDVPVALFRAPAAGTSIRIGLVVVARGCTPVVLSDDLVYQPSGATKSIATVPARAQAAARLQAGGITTFDCTSIKARAALTPEQRAALDVGIQTGTVTCVTPPPPPQEPKCEQLFDLVALVKISGECIKKDPKTNVLKSEKAVRINGIDIALGNGSSVTFDPAKKILRINGAHRMQIPLRFGGRSQGAVVLRDTIKSASGTPGLILPLTDLTLDIKTPGGGNLGGFLLDTGASAKLALKAGGGTLDLRIKLAKKFGNGIQGGTLVKWDATGIELTDAVLKIPELSFSKLKLSNGELRYKRRGDVDTWFGKITASIPAPPLTKAPEAELQAEFVNGSLANGSLELRDINKPFGHPTVFLQRLKGSVAITDAVTTLAGETSFTFGPKVLGKSLGSLDANLAYTFSDPGVWNGSGQIKLLTGQSGEGTFTYSTDGRLDFAGRVILPFPAVSIDGRIKGTVAVPSTFKMAGQVDLSIAGLPKIQGDLAANETAMTVCGTISVLSFGATIPYATPENPQLLQGCGLDTWGTGDKGSKKALRLATTAASTNLPGGLPKAAFAAVGAGAVPNVVLVGPAGQTLKIGEVGPAGIAFGNPADSTAYFLVAKPAAGEWKLEVQDGSPAVTSTRVARGLVEPKVKASVAKDGDRRVLRYEIDGPSGQRVAFVETAAGVERALRTVSGSGKGTIKFTPADGDAGKRDIVAYVEQDGVPRGDAIKVASYRAGATPKPGAPGCLPFFRESVITTGGEGAGGCARLKIARGASGDRVGVRWGKAPDADRYRLLLISSGRREVRYLPGSARDATIDGIERDNGVKVELTALNDDGDAGPTIRASLDPLKIKPTSKQPPKDDGVLGLAEVTAG